MTALEFVLVTALLIVAMAKGLPLFYRGACGMYNDSAKALGPSPYDRKNTTSNFTVRSVSKTTTVSAMETRPYPTNPKKQMQVMKTTTTIDKDETSRTGWEKVGPVSKSIWDH